MATSVQPRGSRFQLRVTHKLLPKPFFFTFDTETEARSSGDQLSALLARGVVPGELLAPTPKRGDDPLLIEIVRAYCIGAPITDSDDALLGNMLPELAGFRRSELTYQWVDAYVRRLKLDRNHAPSTIRKHVGVMGRVLDWHLRRTTPPNELPPANPFRLLPAGYSNYSRSEAVEVEALDKVAKRDTARDRRLLVSEEAAIEKALAGTKRDDRERALEADPAFTMLFRLLIDSGLRLREAYRMRVDAIDFKGGFITLEGSKGHRGVIKPRLVPLKPALAALLRTYCRGRVGLLFPFWNGTREDLDKCSSRLSVRFKCLFDYAGVENLNAHDLRHEATCRWIELRNSRGTKAFDDAEVCKIMGWTSTAMLLRYASLRGEDLVARMA